MLKKINHTIYCLLIFFIAAMQSNAQQANNNYNIVWNTQSKNASESMPCGGGDIGMNVWVEKGVLLVYVTRSGSFNEERKVADKTFSQSI